MVQIGTTQGLRYLHCNLCETEWHVVRVKCSNGVQHGANWHHSGSALPALQPV
ncbi:formate dehydrogenase accessory protein FdhE domain-containing protein [Escherichia coli]|uniref:formate dehydrogenase accessory protein FdhE domain-containing protein n=1 Tax=Escherichia coli TaxID=562 RepID=UPI00352FE3C3